MFNNKGVHARSQVEKFTRYSIRKVSFGVASVAVATGLFFLGGGNVQANSPVVPARLEVGAEGGVQGESESLSLSKVNDNTLASESSTDSEMEPAVSVPEVPATVEPQPETAIEASEVTKVDTSKLGVAIARMQSALEKAGVSEKTAATIENAKEELAKAQTFLSNEKATQEEVDKATRELKNKAFVIESMPKAEKKEANNNQDSRNGQVIPGNGESGFREATGAQETPLADVARVSDDELTKAKQELQGEITKLTAKISTEEAKGEGEIDKEFVELLNTIKTKSETIYNVEIASLTTEKEKHAALQKLKAQKDTLRYYQSGKVDWGAPINNNAVRFGNNNETGVFANLKEGFGEQNFSSAISKQKDSGDQQLGPDTNSPNVGSATYHWKELELTREQAADGTKLNGWKLTNNTEKVTLVKGESPTNITPKPNQTYTPKSAKLYSNNDKVTATGGQNRPNAGGGMLSGLISAEDMKKVGLGRVDRDYYLELGKKGNGIYRDVDVNPNSLLFVNVLHNGAYGPLALPSEGENVKLTIVDAYTGQKLTELKRKSGNSQTEFEQNPGSVGNGWRNLLRAVHIPEGTTKVRVIVEAGSPGQTNKTLGNNPIEDGYIIGGIGIATGPAVNISTNITSEKKSGKYGFTDDAIYGKKQTGTIDLNIRNLGGASITGFQTKYKVTIKVPKGVVLGSLGTPSGRLDLNTANGQSAWELNNTWTSDFRFDKIKSELSFLVDSSKRGIIAGDNRKSDFIVKIPFETTADYVGSSTFEVSGQNGFPGDDSLGNVLHRYGNNDSNFYDVSENVNAPSLKYSNEPNYKYKKTLYIDSFTDVDKITVPVGTSLDKIKELSKSKAKETIESEEYKRKLDETNATATLDDQGMSTGVVATDVAKENAGVIKVPVVHSRDGKNYKNTVDIEVSVVKSTTDKLVVFEGDKITNEEVKSSVKPATIDNNLGVVNNPNEADVINTTGKAGEAGLKISTTVTHEINGTNINETVEVPVTVLPKATGEVEVHKGASVDKVKEVAKTKATEVATSADFKAKLPEGAKDVEVGAITEKVLAAITAEAGTNKGTVKVPVTYTVDSVKYTKDAEITVNVKGSETKSVYVVEGQKPDPAKVKEAVTPGKGGIVQDPTDANLPDTTGKVGATDVVVPTTVKYSTGDETVNVPVTVLPKPEPKGITVLNGTSNENLIDAIRANVNKAITGLTNVPEGVTPFVTDDAIVTPKTDQNGQQTPVSVTVKYRDKATGKVIDDISVDVDVPVNVVGSTPTSKVVFEGDEITAKDITDAVTPGEKGTKGEPTDLAKDITASPGVKEVTVPVTYTDQNGATLTEPVKVKVTVLPKPTPQGIIVAKDSDKEKAKEKALTKAKEAIADGTFKGKLPANVTNVSIDENVENPDLSDDTDVTVTVKYTVDREEKTTVVKVPVTVVEGVPQIVPVDENNKQPNPENSIDKTEYPDDSTFEYDPKTPVNTTMPGDYTVNVIVKDKEGNPIAEVPATVRVVESYPQFVPVDKDNKQPAVEGSIDPKAFPKDTEFTYETPVDTTRPGEKDVVVVAKIGDEVIAKVPAKVMVVEPKTQYVPVDKSNKQPDASKSIDPEQYPDGVTFKYKTPVDTTTPGEKDVVVEAKDGEDKLVEVPAKVKVVEGKEQLIPVNPTEKPQARDSITPSDYPEGSTFEYKVPEGQTEPFDTTIAGDKPVTVVVKDKNGNVLVEVPATIKVVEAKPTPIETPVTKTPLVKEDIAKYVKVPKGGKVTNVENIPDLTTPGKKNPVKVTVELPNGKTITVDVPVNVTPVKEIETPVTNTPLTPEDYTKGIKIPEGGKVTNVENIPDLTTPGKKDPVKVTVGLPNGKTITVEVPVNVTPITPIETPVTKDKLTPEDVLKQIKVPDGATVKVGDLPDLTTPGKKDPVKVTITLPNGKVVTVEVPVNVTPIEDIVKKQGDPITAEDVEKHIPKGVKVISIGDKPTTDVPGERPSIPVVVELPNGIRVTMNIPVIVTPKVTPVVVSVGTPVTSEDVKKHIELPKGWTVTKVGEIPTTTTPGTKPVVSVEIELPDGRKITVDVPVIVTPTVRQIVVPQGTPITPDDVKGHIDLPKEPGWEIVEVGEIPTTIPAGVKPSVKVKIKVPTGEIIEVDVPVIVTPKVTPIVVGVGTPITEEDVKKKVDLPEGWEIVEVGEIPTTETPGVKPVVKVKVKLPDGRIITVDVPVTVTPKSQNGGGVIAQNGDSTVQIVTEYLDENGNRITSDKEGKHNPIELEGYEYSHSTTDAKGNTLHHYKKVTNPIDQEQPVAPVQPEQPTTPSQPAVPTPAEPSVATDSATQPATPKYVDGQKELPNTGTEANASLAALGLLGVLGGFGLLARKKKED